MSDSLESQQFKSWLRRPTLFIANAWYVMAGAGSTIVAYLVVFLAQLAALIFPAVRGADLSGIASLVYELLILALPVIWYAARHEGVSQAMRLNPPSLLLMTNALIAAFFGVLFSDCLSTWWMLLIEALGGRLYGSGVAIPETMDQLIRSILLIGVVPGVCEELFFRGALLGAWERRGTKKALVITSVLFALLHGSIFGLPTQLMMGAVLGYVVILSDSLYVGMIFHTAHNSLTLILSYFSGSTADAGNEIYQNMARYVQMSGGMGFLLVRTIIMAACFAGCLVAMTSIQKARGVEVEKIKDGDTSKLTWQELLLLIAGLLTVGISYLTDLMRVCRMIG